MIEYQKSKGQTHLHSIWVILDDVCDQGSALRSAGSGQGSLSTIMARGRHLGISCTLSLQKVVTACPPLIRANISDWIIFKQRVLKELMFLLSEVSALLPNSEILDLIYRKSTEKPYSFLWVAPGRPDPDDVFHIGFGPGIDLKKFVAQVNDGRN